MGCLVLLAFVLLTISFRSTALDGVEGFGASVLRPFELAANRVAHPFRDATGYFHGLVNAKSENERLRKANASLWRQNVELKEQKQQEKELSHLDRFVGAPLYDDFDRVAAQVLGNPTPFEQSIAIAVGSEQGVAVDDVVVADGGLVGKVTKVFSNQSRVTLITAPTSSVRAVDVEHQDAVGMLDPGNGAGSLVLDLVPTSAQVEIGDRIVTAGSVGMGSLRSLFPRGIVIGTVTGANQTDTDIYKEIQVTPAANLGSAQTVVVLVPRQVAP